MKKENHSLIIDTAFSQINAFGITIHVKHESLNLTGSIKYKTAVSLIADIERQGQLKKNSVIIESSSGNLGVALSQVCSQKGYNFCCITDPNCSQTNINIMKLYGSKVIVVSKKDANNGYLQTRINYIQDLLKSTNNHIWLNQYANKSNALVHEKYTAKAISDYLPKVDYLFLGAGTTGTLMGCINHFSRYSNETKVIGIDSIGSVTFGGQSKTRHIPGLGTSRKPELFNPLGVYDYLLVDEIDTVSMCRHVAKEHGIFLGGSSGTVLAGIRHWAPKIKKGSNVIMISPDSGEKYLNSIYSDKWVDERFELNLVNKKVRILEEEQKFILRKRNV